MERIIAGHFNIKAEADSAVARMSSYIDKDDICIFHNNAPGQHDVFPGGGDEDEDPGADGAGAAATSGALAAGLTAGAIGSLGGPVVALVAAGIGAYSGAASGAMQELGHHAPTAARARRPGGVMLSVRIADIANEARVIAALREGGAADVEEAAGEWKDGDWTDFDPLAPPRLLHTPAV